MISLLSAYGSHAIFFPPKADDSVLSKIIRTLQFDESLDREACFQAVIEACRQRHWKPITACRDELVELIDQTGRSLLIYALQIGDHMLSQALIEQEIALQTSDRQGNTPLHYAAEQGNSDLLLKLRKHLSVNSKNDRGQTPLHRAVNQGQREAAIALLEQGAGQNIQDLDGRTPLHDAVIHGQQACLFVLLEQGADFLALSAQQENLFHLIAEYGHEALLNALSVYIKEHQGMEMLQMMLSQQDADGKTPLHKGVWGSPKPGIVQLLLEYGAEPNAVNKCRYTPLHWAAKHGHFESVQLLLAKGADRSQANANGDTPLDLAIRWGQDNVARLLIDPSFHSVSPPSVDLDYPDLEGVYYRCFEQAYDKSEPLEQILYLEKLGDLYFAKKDYVRAAHLFNNVLAAAVLYEFDDRYQQLLFKKLERIEGLYLEEELGLKTPADHYNYIHKYRYQLKVIRAHVKWLLEKEVPIENVQAEMTSLFQSLLCSLVQSCIKLLGQAPPYAIMGSGSMSRQEMCPYSDIEFIFLIQEDSDRTYFRNLSRLLELRILNLGETAYPIVRPKKMGAEFIEERSFTPKGFSMDRGGIVPCGKEGIYELIGTPEQLASYQEPAWLQANAAEVIVANALTSCCFVMGDQGLVKSYVKCIKNILERKEHWILGQKLRQKRALDLLRGHLEEFKPRLDENRIDLRGFDVKKDLYRPLQMIIGALALYYGLESQSTLSQIRKLQQKGVVSAAGASKLEEALREALAWRFKAHFFYRSEKEIIYHAQEGQKDTGLLAIKEVFCAAEASKVEEILRKALPWVRKAHFFYRSEKDTGLLIFDEAQSLVEIYRVLVPLNKVARSFLEGKALSQALLYDEAIGKSTYNEENNLNYRAALAAYSQSAALRPNDPSVLQDLQRIKRTLGQASDALKYNQERLGILKRKYPAEKKREVATCYDHIGLCLSDLGRYQEALEYQQKALEIRLAVLGERHPDVATSYNNIGVILKELGKPQEALEHYQKALEIFLAVLGERHPNVAMSYNNVGASLSELGRHQEALECEKKALEIRLAVLGERHPDVAMSYNNVGASLSNLGRHHEVLECEQKALEIRLAVLGEQHPDVAMSYNNVGASLDALGRYREALECKQKALEINLKVLGEQHPDVAMSYNNIGVSLSELERYREALECQQKALEIILAVLPERHPDVAKSYNNIGVGLGNLGRHQEALECQQRALEILLAVLGERHPDVAKSYNNIGMCLGDLGRHQEALEHYQKSLKIRLAVLGERHLDVATSYNNVGASLGDLERPQEALESDQKALKIRLAVLGERHPDVAMSYNNIGVSLRELGRYREALEYEQKASNIYQKIFLSEMLPDLVKMIQNINT